MRIIRDLFRRAQRQKAPAFGPGEWVSLDPGTTKLDLAIDPDRTISAKPARISFIITLPFDIPTQGDITATYIGVGHFAGYENVHFSPLPWLPPMQWPGLRPLTSLWIRRGEMAVPDPMRAELDAFGPLFGITPGGAPDHDPILVPRAVAQLTRISPAPASDDADAGERWISDEFDAALAELNEFLVLLASATKRSAIGPITRHELPPLAAFFTEPVAVPEDLDDTPNGAPEPSALLLHEGQFGVSEDIPQEALAHVTRVQAHHRAEGHPFFPYAEAMVSARRSLAMGGNDGLIWPHCDGLNWLHLVRSSAEGFALIERGPEAGRKWDPEWSSSSRSGVIVSARACRSGRSLSGMGCIAARCDRRWRRRYRRPSAHRCRGRHRSSAPSGS